VLGEFSAYRNGKPITITSKKNRALLAILALSPHMSATRDRLVNLLWSDRDDTHARSSLRQSLKLLRKDLGIEPSPLNIADESISFESTLVEVDALNLLGVTADTDMRLLRSATELYRGDLLSGLLIPDPAFEDWLTHERRRLHELAETALSRLLTISMQTGEQDCAVEAAQRLLKLDPLSEVACRTLMQIYATRGQTTQALKLYATLRDRLHHDLGVQPERQTVELSDLIRQRRERADVTLAPRSSAEVLSIPALPLPSKPSIAVLPFENLCGDSGQEYFVDGMVEEIITSLSRMRWLFVIARNSSFTYKGRSVDIKQVGRDLGVRYVLEGSVRKSGNRIRISGQLIDTSTGTHLWADKFEGGFEDIFELQDQMAAMVVGALTPHIEQAEIERAKHKPSQNLDAYDYYLRAKAFYNQWAEEPTYEALQLLERAMRIDPNFALAHAMAARCYTWLKWNGWTRGGAEEATKARVLARRALELSKDDAVVLCFAGWALAYVDDEIETGLDFIDRATDLNPNLAPAWLFSGIIRMLQGESEKAIQHFQHGMRLSPFDPVLPRLQVSAALAYLLNDQYEEASLLSEKTLRDLPNDREALRTNAASNAFAGRFAKAQEVMGRLRQIDPSLRLSNLQNRITLRRPKDIAKLSEGLRRAGLPE
jgi:TolB-like protein/Tfp pilus assembly protein PilF